MDKAQLAKQFSYRLREAMLSAGFNSPRSVSGVSIHKLAEITGYSMQICRKYLRGEAVPDYSKLSELAKKLNVSAGWLLFGEEDEQMSSTNKIVINKNLLHYIFTKAGYLYNGKLSEQEVPEFLIELVHDTSSINANEDQSKKIIDLAFSSVKHFNQ